MVEAFSWLCEGDMYEHTEMYAREMIVGETCCIEATCNPECMKKLQIEL